MDCLFIAAARTGDVVLLEALLNGWPERALRGPPLNGALRAAARGGHAEAAALLADRLAANFWGHPEIAEELRPPARDGPLQGFAGWGRNSFCGPKAQWPPCLFLRRRLGREADGGERTRFLRAGGRPLRN